MHRRRAEPTITDDLADAREQVRWFPAMVSNHVMDLIERYGFDGSVIPQGSPTTSKARKFYDYNEHSRVGAKHGEFVTDEICDRFCVLGTAEQAIAKLRELEAIGVDQFNIYLMTHGQEETLEAYGARHPAAVQRGGGVEPTDEVRRRWDAAAVGWEAERDAVTAFGAPVAAALVAGLALGPGDTVLDLAAGTGDVTQALAQSGARVISTDISPVMVEAARRRGIPDVEHRVMDMQAIDLPDSSVDGVVSRYGYMLVPDPALALRETRRVLKPWGRLAFATWAPANRNPWATAYGPVLIERGLLEPPNPDEPGQFFLGAPGADRGARPRRRVRRRRGDRGAPSSSGRRVGRSTAGSSRRLRRRCGRCSRRSTTRRVPRWTRRPGLASSRSARARGTSFPA